MAQTLAISKRIVSLAQLKERWPTLQQTNRDDFFLEWCDDLPLLTKEEKSRLDLYLKRYQRHREQGELSESTVKLLLVFPLLELAGFYDEPFFLSGEQSVEIDIEEREERLRGRIDTLVFRSDLWVLIVEAKRSVSFAAAIPQALAYLLANPQTQRPTYAMITDGDLFMFIKLAYSPLEYDFSEPISLLVPRRNRLQEVLQILKQIAARQTHGTSEA